jgi:outer membrane lipoprotein-sorting protein
MQKGLISSGETERNVGEYLVNNLKPNAAARAIPAVCARLFLFWLTAASLAAEQEQIIASWLRHQTNVQSWTADFVQTRSLKALTQPLTTTGRVWFAAPQNFRWELGSNQTVAIRNDGEMLVVYPRLKRAERYDFNATGPSEWKDALSLLQSGFPRSRADLDRQFRTLSLTRTNDLYQLALEPASVGARKMMPRIHLFISTNATLAGTELVFMDGSTMRNDFTNIRTHVDLTGKFDLVLPEGFKLVEPLKAERK